MSIRSFQSPFATRSAIGLFLTLAAVWTWTTADTETEVVRLNDRITPIFKATRPAKVESRLLLDSDHKKVVGWITGDKSYAGHDATIHFGEDQVDTIQVENDNTFEWDIRNHSIKQVEIRVGDDFSETEFIRPRTKGPKFCYFVVDRSAYRPGQTLKFVAFLRDENSHGEFVPVSNASVEAQIFLTVKNTRAATLPLKADKHGRIHGEYTFSKADSLGEYTLHIPGYQGNAKLKLAEFRKAKVRLKIDSELEDRELKLKFQAVDFLDKGVPGSDIRFDAKVMYVGTSSNSMTLKSNEFAYASSLPGLAKFLSFVDASKDEKLLHEFGSLTMPMPKRSAPIAAELSGEVKVNENGSAEHVISLNREWMSGGYSIAIEGVLTDYNGREQRASRSISLSGSVTHCDLELELEKTHFEIGEPIKLLMNPQQGESAVQVVGAVTAMRLSPAAPQINYGDGDFLLGSYDNHRGLNRSFYTPPFYSPRFKFNEEFAVETSKRTLVDTELISNNSAEITLEEPGAYQLVCMVKLPDGTKLRNEIGCVVNHPDKLPGLIVQLDQSEFRSDQPLTGWIHSEIEDAIAMVTLRDSFGIRTRKQVPLDSGVARLEMQIPKAMRYGATVEVEFLQEDKTYFSNNFVRILPIDQLVEVEIKTKEVYAPGDQVVIDLHANRSEELDLVVSVFDQSLLGIAADQSLDVKSYFLADERVAWRVNDRDVSRHLDGLTFKEVVEHAERVVEESGLDLNHHQLGYSINQYRQQNFVYAYQLGQLLNAFGIQTEMDTLSRGYWNFWVRLDQESEEENPATVFELLKRLGEEEGRSVSFQWRDNSLKVMPINPHAYQQAAFYGYQQFGQGYGMRSARGDARFSVSGNAIFSHAVSGQALHSHLPVASIQPVAMLGEESSVAVRKNFSDAAFWDAKVRTDKNGKAQVSFKLPDSLTNWQVVVTAVTPDLQVGQAKKSFRTYKPIMVWPMLPRNFVHGDVVSVYASVHNRSEHPQTIEVTLECENGEVLSESTKSVLIEPKSNEPVYWRFKAGQAGFTQLLMTAKCELGSDASLKRLPVSPMVATQWVTESGFLRNGGELKVPQGIDLANAELEVTIVPSLLADALESLDYLVQYPHGCVEQTMSRFLPAIAVKGVLDHANIQNEELEKKLPLVVDAGIKRLLELQNTDGGWGWHGGSQTHEMMTPYALYGLFRAEAAGYEIPNDNAIQLGVNRLNQFIHAMKEPKLVADRIYCMYVYSHRVETLPQEWYDYVGVILDGRTERGDIAKENNSVDGINVKQLRSATLSDYALALALELAVKGGKQDLADRLAKELGSRARGGDHSAFWTTANFSRWGNDRFEISAAALKALVVYNPESPIIARVLNFFSSTKRGNRWNSTKDTAMILYGICEYLKTQPLGKGISADGELIVGDWSKPFRINAFDAITISVPVKQLLPGQNRLRFESKLPGAMFRAVLAYHQTGDAIEAAANGVEIKREFYLLDKSGKQVRKLKSGSTVEKGSYIQSVVTAEHMHAEQMRYVLIENPKPSTCEILPETDKRFPQPSTPYELREDKTNGVNYHHQRTQKTIVDRCVLHAELAGIFMVPPAKVELMYSTLERGHSRGFVLKVE